MNQALVVLSGGQDSTTVLFWAKANFDKVSAITIDYGQRHSREIAAAKIVAGLAGIETEVISLPGILKSTSPLTDPSAQLEQYPDWAHLPGGLEKTFVPMRNTLFLTLAANRAFASGAQYLVTGLCQEDFGGYPDCRRSFVDTFRAAVCESMATGDFYIETPLMYLTKAESVRVALNLPGCYAALGFSHTAYGGAYPPVGKDHATLLRAKGFEQAGVPDPLIVRAYWEGAMALPESANYEKYGDEIRDIGARVYPTATTEEALLALQQAF